MITYTNRAPWKLFSFIAVLLSVVLMIPTANAGKPIADSELQGPDQGRQEGLKLSSSRDFQTLADTSQNVELSVDDGSFETSIGLTLGGTLSAVNRLTPESYPATLTEIKIFFLNLPPPALGVRVGDPLTLLVGANPGGEANITNIQPESQNSTVMAVGQFFTYDVPDVTIHSGDFLVGFRTTYPRNIFPVALDGTAPLRRRSYVSTNGLPLTLMEEAHLAFTGNFGIRANVTFTQTCAYTLLPTSQSFGINGGGGNINVTTSLNDCSWAAGSNTSWITINSGSNGTGNGTVTYSVAANPGAARAGSVTIAGQEFAVNQEGLPLPEILNAVVSGKKLLVSGRNFDPGADLLMDGAEIKKVVNDSNNPTTLLKAKKAGKEIARGQTVVLRVRNANGLLSAEFMFTRPSSLTEGEER